MASKSGWLKTLFTVVTIAAPGFVSLALADVELVPFNGTFSGSAFFMSEANVIFQGAGEVTHLGLTTNAGDLSLFPADSDGCIPNINVETLTAANGDELVLVMEDIACPVEPGVFQGTGFWHVFSGTGRFADATGTGTVRGGANFNLGVFEITLTGQLAY